MKKKINMGGFLKTVSIIVAAGSLLSAIITPADDKELDEKIDEKIDMKLKALSEKKE